MITPPLPTHEEQVAAALENVGITPGSDVIRGITGVPRGSTGVDRDLFSSVARQRTKAVRKNETTNRPNRIPPNIEGVNPPNLICPPVELEDVESDDEDEDDNEYVESDNALSTNLGGGKRIDKNTETAPHLGRGARVRNPPDYYQADYTNISYLYPNEADVINTCF